MSVLEELAKRAIDEPLAPPSDLETLQRRIRRRRHRQNTARLLTLAVLTIGVGLSASAITRSSQPTLVTSATAPTTLTVPDVFGHQLSTNGAIWPAIPIELDALLEGVSTDILGWTNVEWDRSSLGPTEGGITGISINPDRPDRGVSMELKAQDDKWQVVTLYAPLEVSLKDGALTGFTHIGFPDDTHHVEIFHHNGELQTLTTITDPDQWRDGQLRLPEPIPSKVAGTLLVIGRDQTGQATMMTGIALDTPDRLTIAIDKLMAAATPAELPQSIPGPTRIELGPMSLISEIAPNIDLYLAPYADGSGACFYIYLREDRSTNGGCTDSAYFNANGRITFTALDAHPETSYTVALAPDTVTIDPTLGTVHPSGQIVVLPGDHLEALTIDSGVLGRQP